MTTKNKNTEAERDPNKKYGAARFWTGAAWFAAFMLTVGVIPAVIAFGFGEVFGGMLESADAAGPDWMPGVLDFYLMAAWLGTLAVLASLGGWTLFKAHSMWKDGD